MADCGEYVSGKREGAWIFRARPFAEESGSYSQGRRQETWVRRIRGKPVERTTYADGIIDGAREFPGMGSPVVQHYKRGELHGEVRDYGGRVRHYCGGMEADERDRPTEVGLCKRYEEQAEGKVWDCLMSLKRDTAIVLTTIVVSSLIEPDGTTAGFAIDPPSITDTEGGRCLERFWGSLRFCHFEGEPIPFRRVLTIR